MLKLKRGFLARNIEVFIAVFANSDSTFVGELHKIGSKA